MKNKNTIWIIAFVLLVLFAGCIRQEKESPSDEQASGGELTEKAEDVEESGEEAVSIKAIYIGRMDPSFVEILRDGEYESYMFHQDGKAAREAEELESYSAVDIRYIEDEQGRRQIESMIKADPPGVGNAPEIAAEGEIEDMFGADVCMIEGKPYHLAYELLLSSSKLVEEYEYIEFDYYVDDYGRKVITSYEKILTESGRFDGIVGTSISVKLSGNPDEIGAKKYLLSDEVEKAMDSIQLKIGDEIRFHYIVGQEGLKKIVSLERMEK